MPSYNFTNQENREYKLLPDGDYPLEVVKCEFGIVPKSGNEKMEITIRADSPDENQFRETFFFTEKAAWKIDTFVKSCNLLIDGKPPALGQQIEFSEPMVVGLRGWGTVGRFESEKQKGKFFNCVKVWLTNKPKLPKRVIETESESDPKWT